MILTAPQNYPKTNAELAGQCYSIGTSKMFRAVGISVISRRSANILLGPNIFPVPCAFGVSVARTAFAEGPPFSHRKSAMLDPEAKVQRTGKSEQNMWGRKGCVRISASLLCLRTTMAFLDASPFPGPGYARECPPRTCPRMQSRSEGHSACTHRSTRRRTRLIPLHEAKPSDSRLQHYIKLADIALKKPVASA